MARLSAAALLAAAALLVSLIASSTLAQQAVTFARRQAEVGDRTEQTINVTFRLKTIARAGNTVVEESDSHLLRKQQRVLTTMAVGQTGPSAAQIEYQISERVLNGAPAENDPVAGKTYHCERRGEELVVKSVGGTIPTMEEYEIVALNMEALGRENPLAKFFDGRSVAVGETVKLPAELAAELLGFDDAFATKRFSMTLNKVEHIEGQPCAVFQTEIEASSAGNGQMAILVAGPMVMQVDGCRAVSAQLDGPIATAPMPAAALQVRGTGKVSVAIRTRYLNNR